MAEGAVGAGTGTIALGFKAGIGTASRRVVLPDGRPCLLGALVQANFSGALLVRGVRVDAGADRALARPAGNSCMIVLAVGGAFDSRQLSRIARRAVFAMGRVGSDFAPSSGDYAIAFATRRGTPVADAELGPVFAAAQDAVEEAILNALCMATTTVGYRGHLARAVPLDDVVRACLQAGVAGS